MNDKFLPTGSMIPSHRMEWADLFFKAVDRSFEKGYDEILISGLSTKEK